MKTNIFKKVTALLLTIILILSMCITGTSVSAVEGTRKIYFAVSEYWKMANARFAVYIWADNVGGTFTPMTKETDYLYSVEISNNKTNMFFARINPSTTEDSWSSIWNRTINLEIPANKDCFILNDNEWNSANGIWSTYELITEPAKLSNNGYYEINSLGNLYWLAQQINNGLITQHKAKLTNDITIPRHIVWTPINVPEDVSGCVFDGNGHTITMNQNLDNGTTSDADFGLYKTYNYSTIENLILKGNVVVNTTGYVGGLSAISYRTTIKNVASYMNITNNCTTGGSVGGFVGLFGGKHEDGLYSLILNCIIYSDISGYIAGGFIGQTFSGDLYYDMENCAFTGKTTGTHLFGTIVGNHHVKSVCKLKHVYWIARIYYSFSGNSDSRNLYFYDSGSMNSYCFSSGEVAYFLGDAFGQTIGTDKLPILGGAKVYRGFKCDAARIYYSNEELPTTIPDHKEYDENGFCIECKKGPQPAIDSNNDGYYEITNAGNLYWFADRVGYGNNTMNVILTNDIIVNEGEITAESKDARVWNPIHYDYAGTFDGNNKTISGLYVNDNPYVGCSGLFSRLFTGQVKNLGIINSYFNGDKNIGSIVGYNDRGSITNCYSTSIVQGNSDYIGGIVGFNDSGSVTNCYYTGIINGNTDTIGSIVGYNKTGSVTNCYYIHTNGIGGIHGANFAGSAEEKTAKEFENGEVAYLLGDAFGQVIGTDLLPVLGGAKVYYGYENCTSTEKHFSNKVCYDEIPDCCHELGDLDLDGYITIRDVSTLTKYLAGLLTLSECQLSTADVNGNGKINISDATHIQKILAGFV